MIGKIISHYKILEKLGEGGMGVVYKAQDLKLDRFVALKFLPPHLTKSETDKDRFLQEAKAAAALNHNNVCTIYDIQEHDEQQFIVMEYVEGKTLRDVVGAHGHAPLPIKDVINTAIQTAEALKAAHSKGIVHRDVKTENIMVTPTNQVKVMDFGLAKLRGSVKLTKTSSTIGTVAYMSPEHIEGKDVDARTDIFSFGVVLYEMLAGQLPFKGEYDSAMMYSIVNEEPEPIQQYRSDLSYEFLHVLNRALEKDAEERYQSINDMLIELKRLRKDTDNVKRKLVKPSETTIETKTPESVVNPIKKRRTLISTLGVMLIIVIGYFLFKPFKKQVPPWLRSDATTMQLTRESGVEHGGISPDGSYIVYTDSEEILKLKDIGTGEIKHLELPQHTYPMIPIWSPVGTHIAVSASDQEGMKLFIISILSGRVTQKIILPEEGIHIAWSPDGASIASAVNAMDSLAYIMVKRLDGKGAKDYPLGSNRISHLTWSPDSRRIAFIEGEEPWSSAVIRIIDLQTGSISDSLKGVNPYFGAWWAGGLTWSPDGRHLIYCGLEGDNEELFALPLNSSQDAAADLPIRLTNLQGRGYSFWPYFTDDGNRLSYGICEPNWDIYVMPIDVDNAEISGKITPVATDKGRDGDPCWTPDGKSVIFASERDGQPDLYRYYLNTKETRRLTKTPQLERNAQITSDGNFISYHSEGAIWKMPLSGGETQRLTPDSYKLHSIYAWSSESNCLYVTQRDTTNESYCTLIQINLITGKQKFLMKDLLCFSTDISLSPDGNRLAVFGVEPSEEEGTEKAGIFYLDTGIWKELLTQTPWVPRGRSSWTADGRYILHDVNTLDDVVYELIPADEGIPKIINLDAGILRGQIHIDRIDPTGQRVFIAVWEDEADLWMRGGK